MQQLCHHKLPAIRKTNSLPFSPNAVKGKKQVQPRVLQHIVTCSSVQKGADIMAENRPPMDYAWQGKSLDSFIEEHKQWVETKGIDGERAVIVGADLTGVNLEYADLRASIFEECNFTEANLLSVTFRGASLRKSLLVRASMRWAILRFSDLAGADFSEADLRSVDFQEADMRKVCLSGAVLEEAVLIGANLEGAVLSDVSLELADLREANLTGAVLTGASLLAANLKDADLEGADLTDAVDVDLERLVQAKTLYQAKLDEEVLKAVQNAFPQLLLKPSSQP